MEELHVRSIPNAKQSHMAASSNKGTLKFGPYIWGDSNVPLLQHPLLLSLSFFYTERMVRDLLIPMITATSALSLNKLNNFMFNIAQTENIAFMYKPLGKAEITVDVMDMYSQAMQRYTRTNFATVRRGPRVYVRYKGTDYETTTGQLEGLKLAWEYGIIPYIMCNFKEVDAIRSRLKSSHQERKAQQLKQGNTKRIKVAKERMCGFATPVPTCVITEPKSFDLTKVEGWSNFRSEYVQVVEEESDAKNDIELSSGEGETGCFDMCF